MRILVGREQCLDYDEALKAVSVRDYPLPKHFSQANGFYCPNGPEVGKGWFLLTRAALDKIGLNQSHIVQMWDEIGNKTAPGSVVSLRNLVVSAQPVRLTRGQADDPNALYLLELADRRWQCKNPHFQIPINKSYNVRSQSWGPTYYADSMNGDLAWTWDTMIEDVWTLMEDQLGTYPGLPIEPHGTPEGWRFIGGSAYDALNVLLRRIGCILAVDLQLPVGQFSIRQIGAVDEDTDAMLDRYVQRGLFLQDKEFLDTFQGRTPYGCLVHFHRQELHVGTEHTVTRGDRQYSTNAVHTIEVSGPATVTGYADPGIYHPIWDDLPAIYDAEGNLTNEEDLEDRAQERTDDFYRMLLDGGTLRYLTYSGIVPLSIKSTFKAINWRQDNDFVGVMMGGLITEIVSHPFYDLRLDDDGRWTPVAPLKPPDFGATFPVYPHMARLVEITGTYGADLSGSVVYTADLKHKNPDTGYWVTEAQVYVFDANDAELVGGRRYNAMANGYFAAKPLWRTAEEPGAPGGYYQSLFCINIEKQKCVDGVMIDDTISLHSNHWIGMSRSRCTNPTGQGGDGPGGNNPVCPAGEVDTSAFTPFDCDKERYKFDLGGITNGTCLECNVLNRAYSLKWNGTSGKWLTEGFLPATLCGQPTIMLHYSAGYYEVLVYIGANGVVYRLNGLNWVVGGPNVLTLYGTPNPGWCNNFPATITVQGA